MVNNNRYKRTYLPNFGKRALSALIALPIVLVPIYYGGWLFSLMIFLACIIMLLEWRKMIKKEDNLIIWYVIGIVYIIPPCICLMYIRAVSEGFVYIMWLFSSVWATDICAYIVGTTVKGAKILPSISPKKSWSGLIGAIAGAMLIGYLFDIYVDCKLNYSYTMLSGFIAVIAQLGDFLESYFKRHLGVKDSGNLIPGHGGLLDRVDGLMTASVFLIFII